MKKLAALLTLGLAMLCVGLPTAHAQWTNLNANLPGDLHSVYFINETEGYVAGENGVFRTLDGGTTWSKDVIQGNPGDSAVFVRTDFSSVYQNGYVWIAAGTDALNENGVIFTKSADSPFQWKLVFSDQNGRGIHDLGAEYYWMVAVGDDGLAVKSYDPAGVVWTPVSTGITGNIKNAIMYNYQSVLNTEEGLYFENTTDAWQKISDKTFVDVLGPWWNMTAVTQDSSFIVTNNSVQWYILPNRKLPDGYNAKCLGINGSLAAIGTSNGMLKSMGNWEVQPSSNGYAINAFQFPYFSTGYAVADNGVVLKTLNNGGNTLPVADFSGPNGGCIQNQLYFYTLSDYSYQHTWVLDNEPPYIGFNFETPPYNTPGQHTLSLTVFNGVESNTKTITFQVTEPPSTAITFTLPSVPICKSGQTSISVHNTSTNAVYRLQSLSDPALNTPFVQGNGGSINVPTGTLTNPVNYFYLEAKSANSDCQAYLYDSIALYVKQTAAKFQASVINAGPGEPVVFSNTSHDAVAVLWDFGQNAAVQASTEQSLVNSFSSTGPTNVQLIATSAYGCADTIVQSDLFIYDPSESPGDCWAVLERGVEIPDQAYEHDSGEGVAFDKQGNAYYCGEYHRAVFESKFGADSPVNEGSGFYLAKYNPEGVLKWVVKSMEVEGCCFNNESHPGAAYDVAIDEDGDLLLTGWTLPGATIYDSYGDTIHIPLEQQAVGGFVLKINPEGRILWHGLLSGIPKLIDSDEAGNIYLAGALGDNVVYWPPVGSQMTLPSPQFEFPRHGIVKLSAEGNFLWKISLDADLSNSAPDLADIEVLPNGEIFVSGVYASPGITFFSVNKPPYILTGNSYYGDVYLAKISAQGDLLWVNPITTDNNFQDPNADFPSDYAGQITADAAGNAYCLVLGGAYSAMATTHLSSADGSQETVNFGTYVLASFDGNGILRWVAGASQVQGNGLSNIAIDACGKLYVAGNFLWQNVDANGIGMGNFINADGSTFQASTDGRRLIVGTYNTDGIMEAVRQIGEFSSSDQSLYFFPNQMAVDAANNLALTGSIWITSGPPDFYVATDTLSPSVEDGFLAKFTPDFCETLDAGNILGAAPTGEYCPGDTILISFVANGLGNIGLGNEWQLLLSDEAGCFDAPQVLQTLSSDQPSGSFEFVVPTNLTPGEYWLQVNATQPDFVGTPFAISLNTVPTGKHLAYAVCEGESIELLSTAGTAWQWSPSEGLNNTVQRQTVATPQSATTYIVNVSGFCGTVTDTFEVSLHPNIEVGLVRDTFVCQGDTLFLGPNPDISLHWHIFFPDLGLFESDTAILLPNFDYDYLYTAYNTVTGCHKIDTLSVTVPQFFYQGLPSFNIVCPETPLPFEFFSNEQIAVEWEPNPAVEPTSAISAILTFTEPTWVYYTVGLQGYGCSRADSAYFDLLSVQQPELLFEAPFLITTTNYLSYQWYYNGQPIPGATNFNLIPMDTGYYQAAVVDFNGCHSISDSLLILPLSANEVADGHFTAYPNPFNASFSISSISRDFRGDLKLEDVTCKTLLHQQQVYLPKDGQIAVDGNLLPPGVYFIYLLGETGQVAFRMKMVKVE